MKKVIFTAVVAFLAVTVSAQEKGYLDSGNRDRETRTSDYRTGERDYRNDRRDYRNSDYRNSSNEYARGYNSDYPAATRPTREVPGHWAVGPQIGVYTNTDTDGAVFGVGAIGRYDFSNHWRIQPAIMALCEKDCSVDISGDVQYLFRVARWWTVYPMVGVGGNDFNGWSFGVDLGVGTDFAIARRWDLFADFKWIVQTKSDRKNPIVINIGAAYKF